MVDARELLIDRLTVDLFGPGREDEEIFDKPSDRYLTGILYAQRQPMGADEDDRLEVAAAAGDDEEVSAAVGEAVPTSFMKKPSACGLSFRCYADTVPEFQVVVRGGRYHREEVEQEDSGKGEEESRTDPADAADGAQANAEDGEKRKAFKWNRIAVDISVPVAVAGQGSRSTKLDRHGLPGFILHQTVTQSSGEWLITLVLVNGNHLVSGASSRPDELALFQSGFEVQPREGTRIIARQEPAPLSDEDARINELLYRSVRQFAVGHTCSAEWEEADDESARCVRTTWLPKERVPLVSSDGSELLQGALASSAHDPMLAATLAHASDHLDRILEPLVQGYENWIDRQTTRVPTLSEDLRPIAADNMKRCRQSAARMREGIDLLRRDQMARDAFRLMNRAMTIQRRWTSGNHLKWRPFQLGFILQSLPSIVDARSPERGLMDLLWFPTGGGKTEAYLGLIAFTLFLRRLRRSAEPDSGGGIACIMRYTLRLLTLQQFQRAAALTLACEFLRRGNELPAGVQELRATAAVGIGLWVGRKATAESFADAVEALANPSTHNTPAQLTNCPCCKEKLRWEAVEQEERISVRCENGECELGSAVPEFPVYTLDEDIYRARPALILGTVDKFAQIVRSDATTAIFNTGAAPPPELIVQDELHLISGPLGTLAAVYEAAIDLICSRDGNRPKIVGSTATIRRASEQVLALFDRSVAQFPPPGIDADDSCFAVVPPDAKDRVFVGVTTAGRSAKFSAQWVYASLIQGSAAIDDQDARDGYHTLVAYFNSLRELGGALVLVRDDVDDSIKLLARLREEPERALREIVELTSRVTQRQIREILDQLELSCDNDAAVDVVLATNMLSVGVDVGRLALMVVMGQPKSIAEYIQATSRVGRDANQGLIVTVLNNAKTRDRARFETFCGWHRAMYRGVEATSVTPWASRARDRGLHAALVAVARHLIPGMQSSPHLDRAAIQSMEALTTRILERVARIDPGERRQTEADLDEIVSQWRARSPGLTTYWNDYQVARSLMIGAERAAAKNVRRVPGNPWPTPNSMRTVEPGTPFRLVESLQGTGDATQ